MVISELITRLSKAYWTPEHISKYLIEWEEYTPQYNIYWALSGKPDADKKWPIADNLGLWNKAMKICSLDEGDMKWKVTTNTPETFYFNVVLKDPRLLDFYPREAWKRKLLKKIKVK